MKTLLIIGGVIVVSIGLMVYSGSLQEKKATEVANTSIEGVLEYTNLERNHVTEAVVYKQTPPVGGEHDPVWVACDAQVYDEPVANEKAVHGLEHGAVWITYQPSLGQESIQKIEDKVVRSTYTFSSPYEAQNSPIVLTAWGAQIGLDSLDDPRVDQFLKKYRQSKFAPEPGATCQAIPEGMG